MLPIANCLTTPPSSLAIGIGRWQHFHIGNISTSLGSARLRSWAFLFANRRLKGARHSLRITASYLAACW